MRALSAKLGGDKRARHLAALKQPGERTATFPAKLYSPFRRSATAYLSGGAIATGISPNGAGSGILYYSILADDVAFWPLIPASWRLLMYSDTGNTALHDIHGSAPYTRGKSAWPCLPAARLPPNTFLACYLPCGISIHRNMLRVRLSLTKRHGVLLLLPAWTMT